MQREVYRIQRTGIFLQTEICRPSTSLSGKKDQMIATTVL